MDNSHKKMSAKGGSAGRGDAKRRSPEHYVAMNRARWAKHRDKKQEKPAPIKTGQADPSCSTCQRWTVTSVDRLVGHCGAYQIPASATDHCAQYQSNKKEGSHDN